MAIKPFKEMEVQEAKAHLVERHDLCLDVDLFDMETLHIIHMKLHEGVVHHHK